MGKKKNFHIAVLPGDGIGPEVIAPCVELLSTACAQTGGFHLDFATLDAGAACYQQTGTALPDDTFAAAASADAILLGAMGLPSVRQRDGRELAPQIELRDRLDLYAGIRPARAMRGLQPVLADRRAADLDLVLVRESTEGLFAHREEGQVIDDSRAVDVLEITRHGTERVVAAAFELAQARKAAGRPGKVTCVDKANVLTSMAFFRKVFDAQAARWPEIEAEHMYVDAAALNLVRQPWRFDVIVTENMFGDILSDLCAGLIGGMGMAPSADIGDRHAVFQPCHGSAPDIAGTGKANPTATFLSAAMMLDWLGRKHGNSECAAAAIAIGGAIDRAYAGGKLRPVELGGSDGTQQITDAVMAQLARG
jgi:3-isopropylmalate dehydrogenase